VTTQLQLINIIIIIIWVVNSERKQRKTKDHPSLKCTINVFTIPLAGVVCNMRLIPAMEVSPSIQRESSHRRLRLELGDVHVVLNRHLQDGIACSFSLHLHCAPSLRNL